MYERNLAFCEKENYFHFYVRIQRINKIKQHLELVDKIMDEIIQVCYLLFKVRPIFWEK